MRPVNNRLKAEKRSTYFVICNADKKNNQNLRAKIRLWVYSNRCHSNKVELVNMSDVESEELEDQGPNLGVRYSLLRYVNNTCVMLEL